MSTAPAVLQLPTCRSLSYGFLQPRSFKPTLLCAVPSSTWGFSRGFGFSQAINARDRFRGVNTVGQSVEVSASRRTEGNGHEGFDLFQQDTVIGGSSKYRPGIFVGRFESTLNRMSKWLVSAIFWAIIIWRRDAEALWATTGAVLNVFLSAKLKRIVNHERPNSAVRADPGMPSSHAQSIFFIVLFAVITIVERLGLNKFALSVSVLTLAFASYLAWLRVSQQLHTLSQVLAGAVLGSVFSVFWFWLWNAFVLGAYSSLFWVRISVILAAAIFSATFLVYVIHNWIMDER